MTMNKYHLSLIALLFCMSINAQVIKVYDTESAIPTKPVAIYTNGNGHNYKVVFEEKWDPQYVDLGLPSGTLWATCNIGSYIPEGYGDYFAWGEPYPQSSNTYDWTSYYYVADNKYNKLTKYCNSYLYGYKQQYDNKTVLEAQDDAAIINWGSAWCTPSTEQWAELHEKCEWKWTTVNSVKGYKVTSTNGNYIFLPAAGSRNDGSLTVAGSSGYYWANSISTSGPYNALNILFNKDKVSLDDYQTRCSGLSVRPVCRVAVTSISLNESAVEIPVGSYEALTATILPEYAINKKVTWSSSNTNVATVDNTGKISVPSTATIGATATITATTEEGDFKATCQVTVRDVDTNLLPYYFSVSATKKVKFTKGNLYWDGSDFKFEANQTDYPTTWDTKHVGNFYWTKTAEDSYVDHVDETTEANDRFWLDGSDPSHKLKVEGTSSLYVLGLDEWQYLLNERTNAYRLYNYPVKVTNNGKTYENCLIIAPDNFTESLNGSYNLKDINDKGLLCLPCTPDRSYDHVYSYVCGIYWTSTLSQEFPRKAFVINFKDKLNVGDRYLRDNGYSLRLVR